MQSDKRAPVRPLMRPTRTLAELAVHFGLAGAADPRPAVILSGVSVSTADLQPGDLFVAMPGFARHGAEFIESAREAGAVAVLTDPAGAERARTGGLPVLIADDPRAVLGDISAWLYGTKALTTALFGVTGTNGKTSTVHMLEAVLRQMGVSAGLSSTAERHIGPESVVSGLTTPEATELHALLARMSEEGAQAFAVEVSAQGLSRGRVGGITFDVAGFTNLSHDHLDDYGDMHAYLLAKAALFQPELARRAVVSLDTDWGTEILGLSRVPTTTITSRPEVAADWRVTITAEGQDGVDFVLTSPAGETLATHIPVLGRHMAANAGLAIAMIVEAGHTLAGVHDALAADGRIDVYIPGRTERVSGDRGPAVFVDFGHSPDAFVSTLDAVRQVTEGRVIMVFGADGDRDASKRVAMAEAAVRGSDLLIVTDHHPRFEDPASIRATLMAAAVKADPNHHTINVPDPKLAIREAVKLAREGDAILWAGPGHQNYRDIEGVRVPYSARHEARAALREAGW